MYTDHRRSSQWHGIYTSYFCFTISSKITLLGLIFRRAVVRVSVM